MGNKKKQTNEFDNYFDDDFEVVYEDLEDLGSYLRKIVLIITMITTIMTVMMTTPTIMMIMMITIMIMTMIDDDYDDYDYNSNGRDSKRKSATTNRIRIPKIQEEKASRTAQCRKTGCKYC